MRFWGPTISAQQAPQLAEPTARVSQPGFTQPEMIYSRPSVARHIFAGGLKTQIDFLFVQARCQDSSWTRETSFLWGDVLPTFIGQIRIQGIGRGVMKHSPRATIQSACQLMLSTCVQMMWKLSLRSITKHLWPNIIIINFQGCGASRPHRVCSRRECHHEPVWMPVVTQNATCKCNARLVDWGGEGRNTCMSSVVTRGDIEEQPIKKKKKIWDDVITA